MNDQSVLTLKTINRCILSRYIIHTDRRISPG